jgi:hypothetical protein
VDLYLALLRFHIDDFMLLLHCRWTECNTPATPGLAVITPGSLLGSTLLFSVHFCPHLCTPRKTSQSVTHPKIAPDQACLTPEFFAGGLLENKVYLGGTSILSILLSPKSGCHNRPPFEDRCPRRSTQARNIPSWPRPYIQY